MHFTTTPRVVEFTVDDDKFSTKAALPAEVMFKLQSALGAIAEKNGSSADREKAIERLKTIYARILTAESYALFEPRITGECDDDTVPIDAMMFIQITRYIISQSSGKGSTPPPAS